MQTQLSSLDRSHTARRGSLLALLLALGSACQAEHAPAAAPSNVAAGSVPAAGAPPVAAAPDNSAQIAANGKRLAEFFERTFAEDLARQPMMQAELGLKTDYDKWDDMSDASDIRDFAITKQQLDALHAEFDPTALDADSRLSYRLFEYRAQRQLEGEVFRHHRYVLTHMHGIHTTVPSFLGNVHRVDTLADAEAYIQRLRGVKVLFEQAIEKMRIRAAHGIVPPAFVFPPAIEQCQNLTRGVPFEQTGKPNTLWADFSAKVAALTVEANVKQRLLADARTALLGTVGPAYRALSAELQKQSKQATNDDGAWKFPNGQAFYAQALRDTTTTNLSAAEIHKIGLAEVARLHTEMRTIMQKVGFEGDLQAFFKFLEKDARFYEPNTEQGRKAYLDRATNTIDTMRSKLDSLFLTKPKAPMIVKAVEEYRAKSAGLAFYEQGTPDGTRPGIYYANLYDMRSMPLYQLESLAYHEGIPGHHMQISIAQEMESLPKFRQHSHYSAYVEGWALYSELIPKELGLYQDPYSDFGRLAAELWRAVRLVTDTGIHEYRWDRKKTTAYIHENTPNGEAASRAAADRYIVWPSQATAYKIGMNRIVELRKYAESTLGARFDLRKFHDLVLSAGPLPLDILEERVKAWTAGAS